MKINDLGEFGLIKHFAPRFLKRLPKGIVGIGDDCAIVPHVKGKSLLITTDLLLENIHFLREKITPFELGQKSLAVNMSDIASMGGTPLYAFLSLGLPSDISVSWMDSFFDGLESLAKEHKIYLLGGDTTASKTIAINIALIGEAKTRQIKRRNQAKVGDIICTTGTLGDSGAGLKVILNQLPLNKLNQFLVDRHQQPHAHVLEGQWLGRKNAVHAMIDVSDGIESDLRHILTQSKCGAIINLDDLPVSGQLLLAAKKYKWNPHELATSAGEDYCLLLTVDQKKYEQLNKEFEKMFKHPLYKIGEITKDAGCLNYIKDGSQVKIHRKGFDHFKKGE